MGLYQNNFVFLHVSLPKKLAFSNFNKVRAEVFHWTKPEKNAIKADFPKNELGRILSLAK
jgi:hypothetical protein